jgi:hypothetical protein
MAPSASMEQCTGENRVSYRSIRDDILPGVPGPISGRMFVEKVPTPSFDKGL